MEFFEAQQSITATRRVFLAIQKKLFADENMTPELADRMNRIGLAFYCFRCGIWTLEQAVEEIEHVEWKDLHDLGYGPDMKQIEELEVMLRG